LGHKDLSTLKCGSPEKKFGKHCSNRIQSFKKIGEKNNFDPKKKTIEVPLSGFSNLLETLDSDRGPWDLHLSAKMEVYMSLVM